MNLTRLAPAVLLIGALAVVPVACDDDEQVMGITLADLVGTYTATQATLTLDANPSVVLDLIGIGATVTLVVTNPPTGGRFEFTISVPGLPDQIVTGDFSISGTQFTLVNDADPTDPLTGTFSLSGNTLTINVPGAELTDFSQPPDGVPDPATLDAVLQR